MNRKVLVIGVLALGLFLVFKPKANAATTTVPATTQTNYEGKIIIAPNGWWLYVKGNNVYFVSTEANVAWSKLNPGQSAMDVSQSVVDSYTLIHDVNPVTFIG